MAEEVILTREGLEELEKRLEYLKVEKRAEITERIKVAREFGDLSENAEYDAAKNEQAMIEGEILEIEEKLKHAKVIKDSEIKKGVVSIGSKVEIFDETYGENMVFEIVGTTEADVDAKYAELSKQYGLSVELLRQQLPPLRLRHDLRLSAAQAVVVDSAKRK